MFCGEIDTWVHWGTKLKATFDSGSSVVAVGREMAGSPWVDVCSVGTGSLGL